MRGRNACLVDTLCMMLVMKGTVMQGELACKAEVKRERHVRSIRDRRVFVDRVTAEYADAGGERYRKSFEYRSGQWPIVPVYGTSAQLNAAKYQWTRDGAFEASLLR